MAESIKLNDNKYIDTEGVYDSTLGKTQKQINASLLYTGETELTPVYPYLHIKGVLPYQEFFGYGQKGTIFSVNSMNGNTPQQTVLGSVGFIFSAVDAYELKANIGGNTYIRVFSNSPVTVTRETS